MVITCSPRIMVLFVRSSTCNHTPLVRAALCACSGMLHAAAITRRSLDGPSPDESAVVSAVHQVFTQFLLANGAGSKAPAKSGAVCEHPCEARSEPSIV